MKTICDILGPFPSNQMNHNVPSKKKKEKRKKNHNANLLNFGYLDLANVRLFVNEHSFRRQIVYPVFFHAKRMCSEHCKEKDTHFGIFNFLGLLLFD